MRLINSPRCGVPDVIDGFENLILEGEEKEVLEESEGYYPSRKKRYALQGSRWKKRVLTYTVGKYPSKLNRAEVDTDVRKAFDMWQRASGLTFMRRSPGSNVDIEIRFENYYHGDEDAFDGPGGDYYSEVQKNKQSSISHKVWWLTHSSRSLEAMPTLMMARIGLSTNTKWGKEIYI